MIWHRRRAACRKFGDWLAHGRASRLTTPDGSVINPPNTRAIRLTESDLPSTFIVNWSTVRPAARIALLNHDSGLDPDVCGLAGAAGENSHQPRKGHPLQVLVRDNNIDQALRVLKKKMQ